MIYLMRHGADPSDRLGGWSTYGLTEAGRSQVHEATTELRGKGITKIYASDLTRARETAEIIADELGLEIEYMPEFRESNNGLLAGMPKAEAARKYPGIYWNALDWTECWPGGESPEQFYSRIKNAWTDFKQEVGTEPVLLVSHGGVMNIILCLENGIPYTNKETHFKIKDAEIIQLSAITSMKHICELNDQIILGQDGRSNKAPRLTARAIVRNGDGLYAVMYAEKFGLHSLPGGGIENGEDALTALRREVYEETGCTCDDIQELGIVSENRASLDYTQINYYYVVTTADAPGENHLTDAEKASHTIVEWHRLPEMVRLINEQEFERIQQKYLKARDVAALREYQKYLLIGQYSNLCRQYNVHVEIAISHDIGRKLQIDSNRILINDERIPDCELESCIAYAVRQVLLPKMEIETPRLLLRPFRMSDSEDCFGFLCDREDCMNDGGYEPFAEMDEEYFALMEKFANQPLRKMIVRKDTGKVIGTVNIMEVHDRAVETYEIGYCISKAQQRNGYGFEAISTLCDCLLNTLHTDLLIAGAIEKNTISLRMLQKLGFAYEGKRTKGFWHPVDGAIDLLYYVKERTT